uniref:PIK helical domain-containing protein n=1 Tax=Rodentolepis nana TaxID=102285 RepID=A0A0R3TD57_RODNA
LQLIRDLGDKEFLQLLVFWFQHITMGARAQGLEEKLTSSTKEVKHALMNPTDNRNLIEAFVEHHQIQSPGLILAVRRASWFPTKVPEV